MDWIGWTIVVSLVIIIAALVVFVLVLRTALIKDDQN